MTKKLVIILLVLVLVGALSVIVATGQEHTIPVKMTLSGTYIPINEAAGIFEVNLRGSPGKANARGLSVGGPPVVWADLPPNNRCENLGVPSDPERPSGVNIEAGQMNVIFEDGSMIFGNAPSGDERGYICFVPSYVYAPYEVVGGTGRFEEAAGSIVFDITTHPIGGPGGVMGESGTGTGEIILP